MRRRRYLVNGRLRVPFEGYRRSSSSEPAGDTSSQVSIFGHGLSPAQVQLAQQCLTLAIHRRRKEARPCKGPWMAAMVAGVISPVKSGRVGNSSWGWRMHGKRGGLAMARHALHHLRAIAPAGGRASALSRTRRGR